MQVLETERLILRPFRLADREQIHRLVYAGSAGGAWLDWVNLGAG